MLGLILQEKNPHLASVGYEGTKKNQGQVFDKTTTWKHTYESTQIVNFQLESEFRVQVM